MTDPAEMPPHVRRALERAYPDGIPNLFRTLARNPAVLEGFLALDAHLDKGTLTAGERAVVALLTAVDADCSYCRGALWLEAEESGIDTATLEVLAAGGTPEDGERLAVIAMAARRILETRGKLPLSEVAIFEKRGLSIDEMLEIIGVTAAFTVATYANNLVRTRIDPEFRSARGGDAPGRE